MTELKKIDDELNEIDKKNNVLKNKLEIINNAYKTKFNYPNSVHVFRGKTPNIRWRELIMSIEIYDLLNYKPIDNPITEYNENIKKEDYPNVRQRSEAWYELRRNKNNKKPTFGSSSVATLLGFFLPYVKDRFNKKMKSWDKELQDFNDLLSLKEIKFNESQQLLLDWGKNHELNGSVAFAMMFENSKIQEVGCYLIEREKYNIVVSPDGLDMDNITLEIKCPFPFGYDKENDEYYFNPRKFPHKKIPYYYIPQVQLQMHATGRKYCYFISYTPSNGTRIFQTYYNENYVNMLFDALDWLIENYLYKTVKNNPFENYIDEIHKEYHEEIQKNPLKEFEDENPFEEHKKKKYNKYDRLILATIDMSNISELKQYVSYLSTEKFNKFASDFFVGGNLFLK